MDHRLYIQSSKYMQNISPFFGFTFVLNYKNFRWNKSTETEFRDYYALCCSEMFVWCQFFILLSVLYFVVSFLFYCKCFLFFLSLQFYFVASPLCCFMCLFSIVGNFQFYFVVSCFFCYEFSIIFCCEFFILLFGCEPPY